MLQTATKLTDRQIAFRKARRARDEQRYAVVASAAFGPCEDVTYYTDEKGRKVRDTRTVKVTNDEIRFALTGNRVVDEIEMLEAVGKEVLVYMIQKDYLRRAACKVGSGFLWITQAAADNYGLRNPVVCGMKMEFPK